MSATKEKPTDDSLANERGKRHGSPLATTIFVGLRALDGFVIQRALQVLDPIGALCAKLDIRRPLAPPAGGAVLSMSAHDLTPFQAVIWSMSIGAALKQIIWLLFISKEPISVKNAIVVGAFNFVANSINTLLFSVAGSNPTWSPYLMPFSTALFIVGILIETVSEAQRRIFKDKPENEGKPYSGGLFGYARSINYFGYCVWRTAFALASGGLLWAPLQVAFWANNVSTRMVPAMEQYCSQKYGKQWEALKEKVPWRCVPWVY